MTDCREETMEREKLQRQVNALRDQLAEKQDAAYTQGVENGQSLALKRIGELEAALAKFQHERQWEQDHHAEICPLATPLAQMQKERDGLIAAVAAHVTKRGEYNAESERLRAELAEANRRHADACQEIEGIRENWRKTSDAHEWDRGTLAAVKAERDTLAAQLAEAKRLLEQSLDRRDTQVNTIAREALAKITAHTTAAEAPQTLITEPLLTESGRSDNKTAAEDGKTCYLMGEIERRCANCGRVESHHITGRSWACMTFTPPAPSPTEKPCDYCGPSWTGGNHLTPSCPNSKPAGAAGEEKA